LEFSYASALVSLLRDEALMQGETEVAEHLLRALRSIRKARASMPRALSSTSVASDIPVDVVEDQLVLPPSKRKRSVALRREEKMGFGKRRLPSDFRRRGITER
jgi:hypothetical protein